MPVLLDFLLYAGRLTYLFFALPGLTLPKDPWNFRQAIQNRNRRCKVDTFSFHGQPTHKSNIQMTCISYKRALSVRPYQNTDPHSFASCFLLLLFQLLECVDRLFCKPRIYTTAIRRAHQLRSLFCRNAHILSQPTCVQKNMITPS